MRTFTPSSWGKMLLAGIAVLVVGGPGFVLADPGNNADYLTPRSARLSLPSTVRNGSTTYYTLTVFFQDGSSTVYGDTPPQQPGAVFSQVSSTGGGNGSFTGSHYHATSVGTVVLKGSYTNTYGTVSNTRIVKITP